jgi:hypothetical protein
MAAGFSHFNADVHHAPHNNYVIASNVGSIGGVLIPCISDI